MKQEIAMKYNRRIFPLYKGFGWDPLFYSAIIFLFLTEVKGIAPAKVMYAESIYSLFLLLLQILKYVKNYERENDCTDIYLTVNEENENAIKVKSFYFARTEQKNCLKGSN